MLIFERETWNEIYHSLSKNRLRTVLTMIGVSWGVFLYVFLLGMAKGSENGFNRLFEGVTSNTIFMMASATGEPYKGYTRDRKISITLGDLELLKKNVSEIDMIVPRNSTMLIGNASVITRGNVTKNYLTYGDFPDVDKMQKKELVKGRFINENDILLNRKVVVIGKEMAEQLFKGKEDPIGQYIKINNIYFQIIGIYKIPAATPAFDEVSAFIPFQTFQSMYNQGDKIGWIIISMKPEIKDVKSVEDKIKAVLKKKYDVAPNDEKAFLSFNLADVYGKMTTFIQGIQFLTWIVGGLTILAGIIAISNILLITVKERTLEIGIRRALGAKPGEIKGQILLESVFLTIISGLLGFIFGVLMLIFVNSKLGNNSEFPMYNPTVNIWNVLAALCLMIGLGLLIGLIPAQRATQIKPIDALRVE